MAWLPGYGPSAYLARIGSIFSQQETNTIKFYVKIQKMTQNLKTHIMNELRDTKTAGTILVDLLNNKKALCFFVFFSLPIIVNSGCVGCIP